MVILMLFWAIIKWCINNIVRKSNFDFGKETLDLVTKKLNASIVYLPVTLIRMLKSIYKNKKFYSKKY